MTTVLNYPKISHDDWIKPEYRESYNRELTKDDIKQLIKLIQNGQLQEVINDYNVRKIYISGQDIDRELLKIAASTRNVDFFQFIAKKLSYDDKAMNLHHLLGQSFTPEIDMIINKYIKKYRDVGDYDDLFGK